MNFYQQQHEFYCGIDLHARTLYLCILSREGDKVLHREVPAEPVAFLEAIIQDKQGRPAQIADIDTWGMTYKIPFDLAADGNVVLGPYYDVMAFPMQMVIKASDMSITWQANGAPWESVQAAIDDVLAHP